VLSVDINPNVAFQVNDWLSIGGGVSAQYFKLEFSSAIAQFLILAPSVPDATFLFRGDDWAYGFNFGVLAEPMEGTRIGLTYRSKIDHNLKGPLDFTGASPLLGLINGPASAALNLPATIGFSVTRDLDSSWSVSSDVQLNQWSTFKQVVIISANAPLANTENYKDSWMISLGAAYRANDRMTWRAGIGWDQTPVTAQFRAVGLPDTDRYIIGFGLGYRLDDSNSIDGAYAHYFTSEQAHITGSANATDPVTHAVALDGKYNSGLDYLALSYRHRF
jgi:long-chain fatty acid transport protein